MKTIRFIFMLFVSAIIALTVGSLFTGCVGYRHSRSVSNGATNESTTLISVLENGEADMVNSETVDGEYSRTVGVKKVKTSGDSKTAGAVAEGVVNGMNPAQ